ncbi:MAG: hypothetical protein WC292_04625 [Clostridia bacterium]
MSLAKVLEYQDIDMEIYREELKVRRSDETQRMAAVQQQINRAGQNLLKMDKDSENAFAEIERAEVKLAELVEKDKAQFSFSSVVSMGQIDNIENALKNFSEEINNMEREIRKLFRRLEEINSNAGEQFKLGKSLEQERRKLRDEHNKKSLILKEKYKVELSKLQDLRATIAPNLFAAYKNLRENRKMPAFMPYDNGKCSGCGFDIKVDVDSKLNSPGDMAECPNCRRIVYK